MLHCEYGMKVKNPASITLFFKIKLFILIKTNNCIDVPVKKMVFLKINADIWARQFLYLRGCPWHCTNMFGSVPVLFPLNANGPPSPLESIKMSPYTGKRALRVKYLLVENHCCFCFLRQGTT